MKLPEAQRDISALAWNVLTRSDALSYLPTPIDQILTVSKIRDITIPESSLIGFLASLSKRKNAFLHSAMQKLRGIADLRERAVYIPRDCARRELFVKGHEAGHQLIPWHRVNGAREMYQDTDYSLRADVRETFDQEANFFAAELIFQGQRFTTMARDYKPTIAAAFKLADLHGASKEATLRQFVQAQDGFVAAVTYLHNSYTKNDRSHSKLCKPWLVGSPAFMQTFAQIDIPSKIPDGHPWAPYGEFSRDFEGEISLNCGTDTWKFQWTAWWNGYRLFVMLERPSAMASAFTFIRKSINHRNIVFN